MGKVVDSGPLFNTYWKEHEEFGESRKLGPYTLEAHDAWREKMQNTGLPDSQINPRLSVSGREDKSYETRC